MKKSILVSLVFLLLAVVFYQVRKKKPTSVQLNTAKKYPSDVLPYLKDCSITLGDGTVEKNLIDFQHEDYFYTENDGEDWVVYKVPNSGGTTPNSNNTRTELGQVKEWLPKSGGHMKGTLKVAHVSTSGDARVAASYSTVIGQIHSNEGHKNEPLKIFYKKFPGHTKGSVFWNYEINTAGSNSGRWDYSTAVWGHDMSVVGSTPTTYPEEPKEGIALGEVFSYEVSVNEGVMYLSFTSDGHETKTFTKSLVASTYLELPQQILRLYAPIGRDGIERATGYANELQFFKQGAYNQSNGKNPEDNIVWNTGADTYNQNLDLQYANGCYTEVWFKSAEMHVETDSNK